MITIQKACELAKKEMKEYDIIDCVDIGDEYVFSFSLDGEIVPATPMISIAKKNGKLSYFTIPPIENIDVLNNGTKIDIE